MSEDILKRFGQNECYESLILNIATFASITQNGRCFDLTMGYLTTKEHRVVLTWDTKIAISHKYPYANKNTRHGFMPNA